MNNSTTNTLLRIEEGFPYQRLVILPPRVISRCRNSSVLNKLYITHIGSYPSAPHHYVERNHGVDQAILLYCMKGKGNIKLDNVTFDIREHCAVFIPPNVSHLYQADKKDPWSLFWIHFDGEQVAEILRYLDVDRLKPVLYVANQQVIRHAFEDVFACLHYNYSDSGLFAMNAEFIGLLSKIKLACRSSTLKNHIKHNCISDSIRFMREHLNMVISLDNLAAQAGKSVTHFSKLFRERTELSPTAYFIQLKMRHACDQLYQTDLSVAEIGRQVGYKDPYYFSRVFKKVQGVSPLKYRTMAKAEVKT